MRGGEERGMRLPKRLSLGFCLAAVSCVLLALPGRTTQSARLTLLAALSPARDTALSARHLIDRTSSWASSGGSTVELERQIEFYQAEVLRLQERNAGLQAKLESLAATRVAIPSPEYALIPASVLLTEDSAPWSRSLVIALGSTHGIVEGLPAVWHNCLIGRVAWVGPYMSRIVLLTDPTFKARAVTLPALSPEGTPLGTRDIGVLQGDVEHCRLKWIMGDRTVERGTLVVTVADPRHHIPEGLFLGQVTSTSFGRGPYAYVEVEPTVNPNALEFVTILKPQNAGEYPGPSAPPRKGR